MQPERNRRARQRPPGDLLVLAAVDRAERHAARPHPGAPLSEIARHLGLSWGSATSRLIRPVVQRLTDECGWLERGRQHGVDLLMVTAAGAEQLSNSEGQGSSAAPQVAAAPRMARGLDRILRARTLLPMALAE